MRIASRLLGSAGCYDEPHDLMALRSGTTSGLLRVIDKHARPSTTNQHPNLKSQPFHVRSDRGLEKSAKREKPTPLTTVSGRGVWAIHVGSTGGLAPAVPTFVNVILPHSNLDFVVGSGCRLRHVPPAVDS